MSSDYLHLTEAELRGACENAYNAGVGVGVCRAATALVHAGFMDAALYLARHQDDVAKEAPKVFG